MLTAKGRRLAQDTRKREALRRPTRIDRDGGGLGAVARDPDGLIQPRHYLRFPIEAMIINVSGSLLLGCVSGLAIRQLLRNP